MAASPKRRMTRIIASVAIMLIAWLLLHALLLGPASEMDDQMVEVRSEIRRFKQYNQRFTRYHKSLKEIASETYGRDPLKVAEEIRVRIDKMVDASGMQRGSTDSSPVSPKTVRNVYQEVGWRYDLSGTLPQAVDLLFLLKQDPYLHRLEGLSIKPTSDGQRVRLSFRYVAPVLDENLLSFSIPTSQGNTLRVKLKTGADMEPRPLPKLTDNPSRPVYDMVASRQIFRPYIKKRPKESPSDPPPPQPQPEVASEDPPPPQTDWARFKVVGLTDWGIRRDIQILDTQTGDVSRYNPDDALAGGTIVMVDYRLLPVPGNPEMTSGSRLILKIGREYYSVELGQTLAEKTRMNTDRLPESLQPEADSADTDAPASATTSTASEDG